MIEDIRTHMLAHGMTPPEGDIAPGRVHRCPGSGKGPTNRSGWCIRLDEDAAVFGDWSTGLKEYVFADGATKRLDPAEIHRRRAQAERERRMAQEYAAERAQAIFSEGKPGSHPYLQAKRINGYTSRVRGFMLVLPIYDFDGRLWSLQFIDDEGQKRFLSGGRKRGCFIPVHGRFGSQRTLICEGFATGASLAESEPDAFVIAAMDAGNLKPVAVETRKRDPRTQLVVCCDHDPVGLDKGKEAARAAHGWIAVPDIPGDDFNDQAIREAE